MPMRGWESLELEKLISWMEDNQELLRGSTNRWIAKVKEEIFAGVDHIDLKRIRSKYHNMKAAWKAAKQLQEQSGFGLKEDDCESSINGKIFA